jgi:nitroreductase
MKPVSHATILRQLRWRYATKKFDATSKIAPADWQTLEDALVLSPSSFGLQPWKFVVITDQQVKERLVAASWGQQQLADASHVVVFTVRRNLSAEDIDRHVQRIAHVRGVTPQSLEGYRGMMTGSLLTPRPEFNVNEWATRQLYIALGNFLTCAALLDIDACPMEGIEPAKYDEILGLPATGYGAQMVATAGYRAADDAYASLPKVRYEARDVVQHVG